MFEDSALNTTGGAAQGARDGKVAVAELAALGVPAGVAIYAAVDRDTTTAQLPTVAAYLDAFHKATTAAGYRRGVYGEYDVVTTMLRDGHADLAWQTVAWSGGKHAAGAGVALYQKAQQITLDGTPCDVNDVLAANWGQWNFAHMEEPEVQFKMVHVKCDQETGRGSAVIDGVHPDKVVGLTPRSDLCPRLSLDESAALDGDAVVHADLGTPTLIDVTVDVAVAFI